MQNFSMNQMSPDRVREMQKSASIPALFRNVYLWMTLGLVMTALAAVIVAESNLLAVIGGGIWFLLLGELALVWILSSRIMRMSFPVAALLFAAFSVLNGVTISGIFMVYTMKSIALSFFVTAGMFAVMSVIGFVTKKDLSSFGRVMFMCLIGLIIATVVNIFMQSAMLQWIMSYVGVFLFCGLTAYDSQNIKKMYYLTQGEENDTTMKLALLGALTLYLDFINLFLFILQIFGNARD